MKKPPINKYSHLGELLSAGDVGRATPEMQREIMEEWFYENFEDPGNETPWVDGQYLYLHGGPYEADWVLQEEFMDIIPEDVILSFVDDLLRETQVWEWAPVIGGNYESQGYTDCPHTNFLEKLENIKTLLSAEMHNVSSNVHLTFNALLWVSIVSALEVYLVATAMEKIEKDDKLLSRMVEICPNYRQNKRFHFNMEVLAKIYKKIFNISLHDKQIRDAFLVRNNILHRNDMKLLNGMNSISHGHVEKLAIKVQEYVSRIYNQMG